MSAVLCLAFVSPAGAALQHAGGVARTPAYPLIAAAGDIACDGWATKAGNCRQRATSNLFRGRRLAAILPLGDLQYEEGAHHDFRRYFGGSWGRFMGKMRPAVGNHEYLTEGAAGYFDYFGRRAGARKRGYYSYNVGSWHLIALNSNCSKAGGCGVGSPQLRWLRRDLARHPRKCTLAYWHHPRFSSGEHGNHEEYDDFWRVLHRARADVILNGHDHDYERFRPQTPAGRFSKNGIREFVVGTGGANHYRFSTVKRNSKVRNAKTFGVLFLRLRPRSYTFSFVPIKGSGFRDSGTFRCR